MSLYDPGSFQSIFLPGRASVDAKGLIALMFKFSGALDGSIVSLALNEEEYLTICKAAMQKTKTGQNPRGEMISGQFMVRTLPHNYIAGSQHICLGRLWPKADHHQRRCPVASRVGLPGKVLPADANKRQSSTNRGEGLFKDAAMEELIICHTSWKKG
jgi:hypothetical protein